jgi:hypothetical protein
MHQMSTARVRIETGGLKGTDEEFNDLLAGRHYESFKPGPITGAEGWDGQSGWTQDSSGQTKRMEGDDEVEKSEDVGLVNLESLSVGDVTLVALRKRFRAEPAGTKIRLSVDSGDNKRDVTLVLKDLI